MKRRPAVIAYDIVCNRRRRRVFRCLQKWSLDAQYSVFECKLTHKEAEELFLQLVELIDSHEDSLLLGWLDNERKTLALTQSARPSFLHPACYLG